MPTAPTRTILSAILLLGLFNFSFGYFSGNMVLATGGSLALCYGLMRRHPGRSASGDRQNPPLQTATMPAAGVHPPAPRVAVDPADTHALVQQMLDQGRCALLLRPQIAATLGESLFQKTRQALEDNLSLVPDGEVLLGRILADDETPEEPPPPPRLVRVSQFFLDRHPVTNRLYYEFVSAGGYEQMALWDEAVWLAVLDFVDRTGKPGPRYWRNGCYLPGEEKHPVVGICWYEAAACARWLGKRLPSDAEWVKAGAWPVPACTQTRAQRKYPWGETMDRTRANLWGSGPNRVAPVDEFTGGVSVGGVYQLIGNVWEWTSSGYCAAEHPAGELVLQADMKSIRGGAFDTYFDSQATCQFQSGENPLHRRHNIGFRCAVGACDLQLSTPRFSRSEIPTEESSLLSEEGSS
jgi:gamma-glutamyl hercynylcysteine S-oxide synthase